MRKSGRTASCARVCNVWVNLAVRFGEDLPLSVLGLGWWVLGGCRWLGWPGLHGVGSCCEAHAGYVLYLLRILEMRDLAFEMLE